MVKALCKLQDMKQSLTVFEQYQGIYLLLVHPNEQVIVKKPCYVKAVAHWTRSAFW